MTPQRLDEASARVSKSNPLAIGVAIFTPGIRSITVTACGLASLPLRTFSLGLTIGTAAFLALLFTLGYVGGTLLQALIIPLPLLISGLLLLLILGLAIWFVIHKRRVREHRTFL